MTDEEAALTAIRNALLGRGTALSDLLDPPPSGRAASIFPGADVPQSHQGKCVVIDPLVPLPDVAPQGRRHISSFLAGVKALSTVTPNYRAAEQIDIALCPNGRGIKVLVDSFPITLTRSSPIPAGATVDSGNRHYQVGAVYRIDVSHPVQE